MEAKLYENTPKRMMEDDSLFGNAAGLGLFQRLSNLESEVKEIKGMQTHSPSTYCRSNLFEERAVLSESRVTTLRGKADPLQENAGLLERKAGLLEGKADLLQGKADLLEAETAALKKKNKGLSTEVQILGAYEREILIIRRAVLEDWRTGNSGARPAQLTIQRNNIAHGGDIAADVEVIRRDLEMSSSLFSFFFDPFKQHYGISFQTARELLEQECEEHIIHTLNTKVNIEVLQHWLSPARERDQQELKRLTDLITRIFFSTEVGKRSSLFKLGGVLRGPYQQLSSLVGNVF